MRDVTKMVLMIPCVKIFGCDLTFFMNRYTVNGEPVYQIHVSCSPALKHSSSQRVLSYFEARD